MARLRAELQRAKAQLKAGLLMSLESSSARAEQMARQMMIYGRLVGTRELVDSVDAVTAEDVLAFAQRPLPLGPDRRRRRRGQGFREDGPCRSRAHERLSRASLR